MHEAALMQSALEIAIAHARDAGATRIRRIALRVGDLSGVVPEALQIAFDAAAPGTAADGAELSLEQVRVECLCEHCGTEFWPDDVIYVCPICGAISSTLRQGRELELVSLEVY
jgi:hydrogenase nickel incorporation protein HypA/HybF